MLACGGGARGRHNAAAKHGIVGLKRAAALNLMRFFRHESCGQCTPCRLGTEKATTLMEGKDWDLDLLQELSAVMRDASICGLGQAAPNPLLTLVRHFPEEFGK